MAGHRAAREGFTLIEGSSFAASPACTTNRADYEFMRDVILAQLKAALPMDGKTLVWSGDFVHADGSKRRFALRIDCPLPGK